jgi:thiol-disulfide isomerase/thioredoxin
VLVQKKILPGTAPTDHTWAQYQAQFDPIANGLKFYDYLPTEVQQNSMGNLLLIAQALNAMSAADFAAVFADYVRKFPASSYNVVITRYLRAEAARAQAVAARTQPTAGVPTASAAAPNQVFGLYSTGNRTLSFAPAPGLDTVRTLGGLVRSQRPGRAVFVDLWGSWCGPCIAEFEHEPALHKFLADHDIDVVYVALDQPGFRDKWVALAAKYRLQGYHYLAPPALQKALAPTVPYIPRYMLFDKSGNLVEASTYPPSSGDKLYQQLRERLKL